MHVKFPLQFDQHRRTAVSDHDAHIREMIEMVIFTSPKERVHRATFGCGVLQTLFAGNSDQLAAALQAGIQAALNQWLGDLIEVQELEVDNDDSKLFIALRYVVLRTGETRIESFERRALA